MSNKISNGSAFGKIILIGEHAVVYHKPAIAIPFTGVQLDVSVTYKEGDSVIECYDYKGSINQLSDRYLGLKTTLYNVLDRLNESVDNLDIKITSSIPIERGMGSSAAVSSALIKALYKYYDQTLSDEVLSELVNASEKIVHGNPSGIDTAIVVYEKPLYFVKGEDVVLDDYHIDAYLIVADTGVLGNTKEAVMKVKQFIKQDPDKGSMIMNRLESLTLQSRDDLKNNRVYELAKSMNEAQDLLSELGVSSVENTRLVDVARKSGALAAKLTGGGLGGCIIALCKDLEDTKNVIYELDKAHAKQTWVMNMNKNEVETL